MANTTDPSKPGTGLHDEKATDTGGTDRYAMEEQHGIVTGDFDREINLRGIIWTGVWLAVGTILANVAMWWFLRGFQVYDKHHEVPVMPMAAANPQKTPPGPLLQPENPTEDRNKDMYNFRKEENKMLDRASWVDHPGGTLRVPVDVAIDAIAQRGVAPFPATGAPSGAGTGGTASLNPIQARVQNEQAGPDTRKPGATVQSSQAKNPAKPAGTQPAKPPAR
ncbi:MAG TPA: hypothetical protein VGP73_10265 [Thermoanaerobaculia bacterium]